MATHKVVRQYGAVSTHGTQTPSRIVIHTTEGDSSDPGIFAHGFGAHYVIGDDGTIHNYVPDNQIAWGTGGNNSGTLDIEIVGHASFSSGDWKKRAAQLRAVSWLIGFLSKKYKIPLKLSTARGVSTHAMNSKLYAASDGHWDPGPGFPLKQIMTDAARQAGTTADFSGPGSVLHGQASQDATSSQSAPVEAPAQGVPSVSAPPGQAPPTALGTPGPDVEMPGSVDYSLTPNHAAYGLWQQAAQGTLISPETMSMLKNAQLSAGVQ